MKKIIGFLFIFMVSTAIYAQQKFALVIGNGNYNGITPLRNPVNDANDIESALLNLGFSVEKVINGNLEQMETGVNNLKRRLGASRNSYGFFFFAGHGVQANGENYLIPIEANNIHNETHLRQRAVSVQFVMDSMNEAGNELSMIVLDACRDNPFGWSRSGSRGLTVLSQAPTGSIVMYATSANSVANDGTGRNGLFTTQLLNNLRTDGLSIFQVFDNTMNDVINASNGRQHPELSLRFPGSASAYLGSRPDGASTPMLVQPAPLPTTPLEPSQLPATNGDRFNLDGKKIFAVSATGIIDVGDSYGGGATVTIFEKYNSGKLIAPSFFLTAKWVGGGELEADSHFTDTHESFFVGGIGFLLKGRLTKQNRLVYNIGLSLEYFTGSVKSKYIEDGYELELEGDISIFGGGIQTGLSFRVHPNISLDINGIGKLSLGTNQFNVSGFTYNTTLLGVELGVTYMYPY